MQRILRLISPWRRLPVLSMVVLSAGEAVAAPATPARPAVEVSWSDVARLVDAHPVLAAGKLRTEAARAATISAGAVPNPTLEGTLGQGRAQVGEGSRVEWGLTLNLPLGWIAQRRAKIAAAEGGVSVAEAEAAVVRREVLLQLRALFWNLAYEQARVASFEALAAQTETLVQTVQRRMDKGEARPVEGTRVEIELEKVQSELDVARTTLAARQAALGLWLRAPAQASLVAHVDVGALPPVLDREAALAKVRATHPAILAARMRERVLAAELASEKLARVPSFSLVAFTSSELDRRAFGAGLSASLPIWNWNGGPIAQTSAKLAGSRKEEEATTLTLETTVLEAQAACQASVRTAERLGGSVVPRSVTAAATMERTYQLGEANLLEVIDARRTLVEARRLHLNALAQAQTECSRLGALVGEDRP